MFLRRLREDDNVDPPCCYHADWYFGVDGPNEDRVLSCGRCGWKLSLCRHLVDSLPARESLELAVEYVRWNGDRGIHFLLDPSTLLRNRAPARFIETCYATVVEGCYFLKLLHAPFLRRPKVPRQEAFSAFRSAIERQLEALARTAVETNPRAHHVSEDPGVLGVARVALLFLKDRFARRAERYYDVLAPRVKKMACMRSGEDGGSLNDEEEEEDEENGTVLFERRFEESDFIRRRYSRHSADFDAVHVAALCVLFRNHLPLVCDLALGYLGDVSCGLYDHDGLRPTNVALERRIRGMLADELALLRYHRHEVPGLPQDEESCRSLFDLLARQRDAEIDGRHFEAYLGLRTALRLRLGEEANTEMDSVFPRCLFRSHLDYAAFATAVRHYEKNSTGGGDRAVLLTECRRIYRFVLWNVARAMALSDSRRRTMQDQFFWTAEVVKDFLKGQPECSAEWQAFGKTVSKDGTKINKEAEILYFRNDSKALWM